MVLLEEYYELNECESISKRWKVFQIIAYICASLFGIACGFTMSLLTYIFDDECYLFAKVKIKTKTDDNNNNNTNNSNLSQNNNIIIDSAESEWGYSSDCEFCQYTMICSFIVATLWTIFFVMCGKGGKSPTGLPQPWRIVLPSLIFNLLYFIISLSATLKLRKGTEEFCNEFDRISSKPEGNKMCYHLRQYLYPKGQAVLVYFDIVQNTCWACMLAWLFAFLIALLRIFLVVDFHLYKVCVFRITSLEGDDNDDKVNVNTANTKPARDQSAANAAKMEKVIKVVDYEEAEHDKETVPARPVKLRPHKATKSAQETKDQGTKFEENETK